MSAWMPKVGDWVVHRVDRLVDGSYADNGRVEVVGKTAAIVQFGDCPEPQECLIANLSPDYALMPELGPQMNLVQIERDNLTKLAADLGHDEVRVLVLIAQRLTKGADQYGILNVLDEDRDWLKESLEEELDDVVYRAAHTLRKLHQAATVTSMKAAEPVEAAE